ncbi:hypothetical protein IAT38_004157 [Cryptococcus sp. DSM 104549]
MVNILKSLFKSSSSRRGRSASPSNTDLSHLRQPEDLYSLSEALQREIRSNGGETGTMKRLLEVLEEIERSKDSVTPFDGGGSSRSRTKSRGTGSKSSRSGDGGALNAALEACGAAVAAAESILQNSEGRGSNEHLVGRIITILEAQRDELYDMWAYIEGKKFSTLVTLQQIYAEIETGLKDVTGMPEVSARESLVTLTQILQEGPDYLIDVTLISGIIWQAEIIDSSFAAEIRQILDKAIEDQSDLVNFRKAGESIIAISTAIPRDLLDDVEAEEAYKAIGALLKQLRVDSSSLRPTPVASGIPTAPGTPDIPLSLPGTPTDSPLASPAVSPIFTQPPSPALSVSSGGSTPSDPDFKAMTVKDLQANYGTGVTTPSTPLPGLSSFTPTPSDAASATPASRTPAPSSPASASGSDSSQEIWEYRGQMLTRSALGLVLRQEALAQADSSGQYAGEVSWDDLRNAWVPKWVKKLKVSDVAEGEIPDCSPAGFQEKDQDEWGNKIGWYGVHKEMYYKDEPKWELKDD